MEFTGLKKNVFDFKSQLVSSNPTKTILEIFLTYFKTFFAHF